MCKTKPSWIVALKAEKRSENPQCKEIKKIKGVDVHGYIVETHNVFSVETVNNASGQSIYVEIILNNIPVKILVDSRSNVTLIPMIIFNKIKNKGKN